MSKKKFKIRQPTGNQGLCASLNPVTGNWYSQNCLNQNLAYICKVNGTVDFTSNPTQVTFTCPTCPLPICSTTASSSRCPLDYIYYGLTGYCYKFYDNSITWSNSELKCNTDGGHLVSIHSYQESVFIEDNVVSNAYAWIGLNFTNNQWVWSDGTQVDYTKWYPGTPYNITSQSCTIIWLKPEVSNFNLDFEDENCDSINGFICKTSTI
uniref:C-type lectin domain-containing protein n=1 Tax=Acrobeloides nanus TaxID=290746 RepID=A0A914EQ54_9BILA